MSVPTLTRAVIALLASGVLLASAGCSDQPPSPGTPPSPNFTVSYAGAGDRLSGLSPTDRQEQVTDWTRTALAAHLELDSAQLRDTSFDTTPVREDGFSDLTRQPTGPGRSLLDGDTLHVLVPVGDPAPARTIGLQLDQYRTDSGADAPNVQVHHYRVHTDTDLVDIAADRQLPTGQERSALGYVSARLGSVDELKQFLDKTSHLSRLELRDSEVWADGWNWPAPAGAKVQAQDVSVLQRGYASHFGARPGFSLDPQDAETTQDLLAVVPGLSPDLAARIIGKDWAGSDFRSADEVGTWADAILFGEPTPEDPRSVGLPTDRTQLWALKGVLEGQHAYSQARYDGGLAGTQVGMTLFYTDYVAKNWTAGVGTGVPAKAVAGFVPDSDLVVPWSQCGSAGSDSESGRLWFGQADTAFGYGADSVDLGAQATRLFARSNADGGKEVETSYGFGRGLRWWDENYAAVAAYEPQYQRLDQLMRWSGALDWLSAKDSATLPTLPDAQVESTLTFANWFAQHPELKERAPVDFVKPSSATEEALAHTPSPAYQQCGGQWIEGGVSLSNSTDRTNGQDYHPDLPSQVKRAGLFEPDAGFDDGDGTGHLTQVSVDDSHTASEHVRRDFSPRPDGANEVETTGDGRNVAPLGAVKAWLSQNTPRKLSLLLSAGHGLVSETLGFQGKQLGKLTAQQHGDLVTVQWSRGPLDRVRQAMESVQNKLVASPSPGSPPPADGVLYGFTDADGRQLLRVGGKDDPWLSISDQIPPADDNLAFRIGEPNPGQRNDPVRYYLGTLVPAPDVLGGKHWLTATPDPHGGQASVVASDPPADTGSPVRVSTPDGRESVLYPHDGRLVLDANDPLLGLNGTTEGAALLRGFTAVDAAMHNAAEAKDGFLRGVELGGDGVALVGDGQVILVPADHPWAARALGAKSADPAHRMPLLLVEGNQVLIVDESPLTATGPPQRMGLGDAKTLAAAGVTIYVHEHFRSTLTFEDGPVITSSLPSDTKVTVRQVKTQQHQAVQPEVRVYGGGGGGSNGKWLRVDLFPSGPTISTATPTTTPTTATSSPAGADGTPATGTTVALICPDTNEKLAGCGSTD
ncbi:hypothetical protein OG943_08425 [Amycolatopsis sp. NBC_00345]|uniref:hypothetical protein n=1 Tax=Amycolatopsis sp. NBC_00345 TaxID=2975955 RepID=UPI002E25B413